MRPNTLAGLLLVLVPLGFNATFLMLQRTFEYPDILRKPTEYILRRFKEGGASLRRLWYAFTFSAIWRKPWSAAPGGAACAGAAPPVAVCGAVVVAGD